MLSHKHWLKLSLLLVLVLAACAPASDPGQPPTDGPGDPGYPAPGATDFGPGYPVEDTYEESFYANLTPIAPAPVTTSDLGAVTATLIYANSDRPVRGQPFFAAGMLPVEGVEDSFIPKLDTAVDQQGFSDAQGLVVISGIPPGNYALVLMTPLGPILVEADANSEAITFEITAGEVTDLGTIDVLLDPAALEPEPREP